MIGPIIKGKFICLRPVVEDDADFILTLRTHPVYSRYLNKTPLDIASQIEWIRKQRIRTGDYYFIIQDVGRNENVGVISLYDCTEDDGFLGRWICPFNSLFSLESILTVYRFGFSLYLKSIYTQSVIENKKVIKFHENFGSIWKKKEWLPPFWCIRQEMSADRFKELEKKHQTMIDYFYLKDEKYHQ